MKEFIKQPEINKIIKAIRFKAKEAKFKCERNIFNGGLNTGDPSLISEINLRKTLSSLEEFGVSNNNLYDEDLLLKTYSHFTKTIHWSTQVNFLGEYLPDIIELHQNCSNVLNWCFSNAVGGSTLTGNFLIYLIQPLKELELLIDNLAHLNPSGKSNQELLDKLSSIETIVNLANANNNAIFRPINDFYEIIEKCIGAISSIWSMVNIDQVTLNTSLDHAKILVSMGSTGDWNSLLNGIGVQVSRDHLLKYSDPKYNTQYIMERATRVAFRQAGIKKELNLVKDRMILSTTLKLYTIEVQDVS